MKSVGAVIGVIGVCALIFIPRMLRETIPLVDQAEHIMRIIARDNW